MRMKKVIETKKGKEESDWEKEWVRKKGLRK